jgi:DnaK suppressor protein
VRRVAELEHLAQVLAAERAAALELLAGVERELSAIIESASSGADDEHDPEGATLAFERQHAAALLNGARQRLAEIEAAMARLEEGRYGQCAACGGPIGAARLSARPTASTCIRCAAVR